VQMWGRAVGKLEEKRRAQAEMDQRVRSDIEKGLNDTDGCKHKEMKQRARDEREAAGKNVNDAAAKLKALGQPVVATYRAVLREHLRHFLTEQGVGNPEGVAEEIVARQVQFECTWLSLHWGLWPGEAPLGRGCLDAEVAGTGGLPSFVERVVALRRETRRVACARAAVDKVARVEGWVKDVVAAMMSGQGGAWQDGVMHTVKR
jgi:hypothetical protein